jgi:UDP-N-acetylmuramyl pentapeptide phosphotransferase/UDP-N-acetylglucosamine-1-phosphate transferase
MRPGQNKSRSLLIATAFFLLVAVLVAVRPPVSHTPVLRVEAPENLTLRLIFSARPALTECERLLARAESGLAVACKDCKVADWGCVSSPGPLIKIVQSGSPLDDYALSFSGGTIIFKAADALIAKSACEQAQLQGSGVCHAPGQSRPALLVSDSATNFISEEAKKSLQESFVFIASVALLSFLVSLLVIKTKSFHGRFTLDSAHGVQRSHIEPTPRIGGIGIYLGLTATVLVQLHVFGESGLAWIAPLLFAALPAFGFGLAEDLTKSVGVAPRLLATMASSLLAWWLTGVSLKSLDLAPFDLLLSHTFFSLLFTAFAVGGIANAINIIDGFHGLAAGVSVVILAAIAALAAQVGDMPLAVFASLIAAAAAGFLLLNFPRGRIFLGDGGAYLLGFLIGWCGVLLPTRNPDVSAWASLLICAYPVAETLFSITRRLKLRLHIGHPDREHLHSLIHQLIKLHLPSHSLNQTNALVAPPLWIFAAIPIPIALMFSENPVVLGAAFLAFCVLYGVLYSLVSARCERALNEQAV